ncbi:hypothetical protein BDY24DRAFT_380740 [Mrakia frigida]|uniref:uncharacterized protein n=1 Tax=Mrakia frigida TaxID=29902 RepID=UPI003FCBF6F0
MSSARLPVLPLPLRKRLLNSYLSSLSSRPLLTKSLTLALSYYLQSIISTYLAVHGLGLGLEFYSLSPAEKINRIKQRAREIVKEGKEKRSVMMAAYGGLISGPMKHYLPLITAQISALLLPSSASSTPQAALISGLLVGLGLQLPVECLIYVLSMGYIGGARSSAQLKGVVSASFARIYKAYLIIHPLAIITAVKLLPPSAHALFGTAVQFVIGTGAMTMMKVKKIKAMKKAGEESEKKKDQ